MFNADWKRQKGMWAMFVRCRLTDRRDPLLAVQTGEFDRWREIQHDRVGTCITKTQAHTELCSSLQKLQCLSVCVCWQRQTVMLLPAAQPPEGKRQTLHPIYSNTARYRIDTLSTTTPLLALARSCNWVYECSFASVCLKYWLGTCVYSWACMCLCISMITLECTLQNSFFYLHVNRTGPQRMSTHHITNPTQQKKQRNYIFLSFSGSSGDFFSSFFLPDISPVSHISSHCFAPICINTAAVYSTVVQQPFLNAIS